LKFADFTINCFLKSNDHIIFPNPDNAKRINVNRDPRMAYSKPFIPHKTMTKANINKALVKANKRFSMLSLFTGYFDFI
jgi:hypothetical protein